MNKLELRYAVYKSMASLLGSTGIKAFELVDATPADPEFTITVVTDDPYNISDPDAVRRYRIKFEEVADGGE